MMRFTSLFPFAQRTRSNSRFLSAATGIFSGAFVAVMAVAGLWNLWLETQAHLPFAVPQDFLHYVNQNAPSILSKIVSVIGSLAGLLMGLSWFLSGLGETGLGSKRAPIPPGALMDPAQAANWMEMEATGVRENDIKTSPGFCLFGEASRRLTPATRNIVKELFGSVLKWSAFFILLLGIFRVIGQLPDITRNHVEMDLFLPVSEAYSLFVLVGGIAVADLILALSLFLRSPKSHSVDHIRIAASTKAQLGFLLSLFEESVRMWASAVSLATEHWRGADDTRTGHCGSLLETRPGIAVAPLWKSGFACMIGSIVFILVGFYGLIHFELNDGKAWSFESIGSFVFLFLLKLLFLVTILLAGRHYAKWARRFSAVTTWTSNLFLVTASSFGTNQQHAEPADGKEELTRSDSYWKSADFQDVGLTPQTGTSGGTSRIAVDFYWGEAVTESMHEHSDRSLLTIRPSAISREVIGAIVVAPFDAHFHKEG